MNCQPNITPFIGGKSGFDRMNDLVINQAVQGAHVGNNAKDSLVLYRDASHDWALNREVHLGLRMNAEIFGHKKRRYGGLPLLIHQIWGAHQSYNDPALRKLGINPDLATYLFTTHDLPEETRSAAEYYGLKGHFREEEVYQRIVDIWPHKSDSDIIYDVSAWMTDTDGLHSSERIDQQKSKCFDENGRCKIDPLRQTIRALDKLHHVLMDAAMCQEGHVPDEKIQECYDQARMKSYILGFPDISPVIHEKYQGALDYLGERAVNILIPAQNDNRPADDHVLRPALTSRAAL